MISGTLATVVLVRDLAVCTEFYRNTFRLSYQGGRCPLSRFLLDPSGSKTWMARLSEIPLLYEPGECWLYHTAADVLGVLIARLAKQPLETFLQERIFTPLAMVDTSFAVPPEKRHRLAVAYAKAATGELTVWDHPRNTRWADLPLFPSGGAGLVSTVDDYQRFGRMLLDGGELDGGRLLSRKTGEAMTTDYLTPEQHTHPATMYDIATMWTDPRSGRIEDLATASEPESGVSDLGRAWVPFAGPEHLERRGWQTHKSI